jgi:hypothetical protein
MPHTVTGCSTYSCSPPVVPSGKVTTGMDNGSTSRSQRLSGQHWLKPSEKGNMDKPLFELVLSDLHAFHMTGLTPRNFVSSTGATLNLNFVQEYLLECWDDFKAQLPDQIDLLILNGDLAEGQQPAEEARCLMEADPEYQANGVIKLLKPITDRVRIDEYGQRMIVVTRGTRYHTGRGGRIEVQVAERLGAIPDSYGRRCWPWFTRTVGGVYHDVSHRQSWTIRYRSMPLEREIGFLMERYGRARRKVPEHVVIVRSHTHYGFKVVQEDGITAISTPCWKVQDDFAQTAISPNRYVPEHVGAVGMYINPPGTRKRVEVVKYLYAHPQEDSKELFPEWTDQNQTSA